MFDRSRKFIKKVSKVKVKSFSDKILKDLEIFLNDKNSKINIVGNKLYIQFGDYEISLLIEKNRILYIMSSRDIINSLEYKEYEEGYSVVINEEKSLIYELNDKYSYNFKSNETFKFFDKKGYEQFRRTTERISNHYKDKKTGEIIIQEPNAFENYIENTYTWRTNKNNIMKRCIRKYEHNNIGKGNLHLNDMDNCLLRYEKIEKSEKEIPSYGRYFGISNNIFFEFFKNQATWDEVIEDFHNKKYKIYTHNF